MENGNGVVEGQETEKAEEQEQAAPQMIGGEIHIVADARTGSISVSSPQNFVAAMGLLEVAKVIMTQQHLENVKAQERRRPPAIIPAGMDAIKNLRRPS